jgi:acyl carrier protein
VGLDTVELIMGIEAEFGVEIPDTDAPNLAVLGDMHKFIVRALRNKGDMEDEERIWQRLSEVVVAQLGVQPSDVTRAAHIVYDLQAD